MLGFRFRAHVNAQVDDNGQMLTFCFVQDPDMSTHHCTTCQQNLCAIHQAAHSRGRETKHHNLVDAQSIRYDPPSPESAPAPYCCVIGHEKKRRDVYCVVCEELACDKCALGLHRDHVIGELSEVHDSVDVWSFCTVLTPDRG